MDCRQKITVCPILWDKLAARHLNGVGGLSSAEYENMKASNVTFYAIFEGLMRVASVVMRFERHMHGHIEAVLVAAGGKAGQDLTLLALPEFEKAALEQGAHSFRLHTRRSGLVRKLAPRARNSELLVSWSL